MKGKWKEKTGGFTVITRKSVSVKEWQEKMEKMKNIGGDRETLVLFVNEKFDEMGKNVHSIELFPFCMSNYIKLAMNSFIAGSQLQASW